MRVTIYTNQLRCTPCKHVWQRTNTEACWKSEDCPNCKGSAGSVDVITEDFDLCCPKCGADDRFEYIEDVTASRDVLGVKDGQLRISGIDSYDNGSNGRFNCMDCVFEFPIPNGIDLEWE